MTRRGQWLSANPDKAWAELFFLAYSPVWIAVVGIAMLSGWLDGWSDVGFLAFSVAVGAPCVLGPALLHRRCGDGRPWHAAYWLKLNLFAGILVAFGTYFGTHYFFDLMGMRYGFPVEWTFESPVLGRRAGRVPVFMYPLTQAYFVTYFVGMSVVYRWLRTRFSLGTLGRGVAVVALAYIVAVAETLAMANPLIRDYFAYADRARMLALGSFGYAVYFVVGLPVAFGIDEPDEQGATARWKIRKVAVAGLATYMGILCGLELWAQLVGPL